MKNLDSVFAAYMFAWAIFFIFYLTVARRTSELRTEIQSLKKSLQRGQ
jgi:preprotein translocase subunit YajC